MSDQTLNVKITGDTSDLGKATADASRQLEDLKGDVEAVDATSIDVPVKLELDRLNRDKANLEKTLDGIERRKANPDVDLDITQLLKDEARVRKAIKDLDARKVEIETELDVDTSGLARFTSMVDDLGTTIPNLPLGPLAGGLGKVAGPAGLAAAAFGGWKLGELAADVETTTLQLGALTGSAEEGAQAFELLRDFAAATPFELDQVTTAARSLIAAGAGLEDLPDWLTDLGNVAAATGAPLEEVALIFQQMLGKGKISNEEMLQLAERGVPAYQALADQLGVTVPEVQKLAEQGKLGAEDIQTLASALGDLYPTAMGDQAESFNGQMSTLHDNVTQIGQNLGAVFLPLMSDLVGTFTDATGAVAGATQGLGDFFETLKEDQDIKVGDESWWRSALKGVKDFATWSPPGTTLDEVNEKKKAIEDAADAGLMFGDAIAGVGEGMAGIVGDAAAAAEGVKREVEAAFAEGVEVRTRVNFLISQDDLADSIREATSGKDAVTLPANLHVKGISGLSDEQKTIVNDLSSFVSAGLEEGARKAQIDPEFDVDAWNRKVFRQARALVIKAGIDPANAERFLSNFLGIKRTATITAEAETKKADAALDVVAAAKRVATIFGDANTGTAKTELDNLTKPEVKTIYVDIVRRFTEALPNFGGGSNRAATSAAGPATNQLLAGTRAADDSATVYFAPRGGVAGGRRSAPAEPRRMTPKQTPIAVYLDGAAIADQLSLRTDRLASVGSIRREA